MFFHPSRLVEINDWVKTCLLLVSPHYTFVAGFAAVAHTASSFGKPLSLPLPFGPGAESQKGAFDWEVLGRPLAYMGAQVR